MSKLSSQNNVLYTHNDETLTGLHDAGLGFDMAILEMLSSGGKTTDWSFQWSCRKYVLRDGNLCC